MKTIITCLLFILMISCNSSNDITPENLADKVKGSYYADIKINELEISSLIHLDIETPKGLLLEFDSSELFYVPNFEVGLTNISTGQVGLTIGLVEFPEMKISGWNNGIGEYAGVYSESNQYLQFSFLIHESFPADTIRVQAIKVP